MSHIAPLNPLSAAAAQTIDHVEQRLAQAGFAVEGSTPTPHAQISGTCLSDEPATPRIGGRP